MKTHFRATCLACLALCGVVRAGENAGEKDFFTSPDGRLTVTLDAAADDALGLAVAYDGAPVVRVTVPGFEKGAGVAADGFVRRAWENAFGERRLVRDDFARVRAGNVELRLYDAGVAWRLTADGTGPQTFASESTVATFAFDGDWRCWPVSHNQGHYEPFRLSNFDEMAPRPGFAPVAAGIGEMHNYATDIPKTAEGPFVVEGPSWTAALGEAANLDFAKVRFAKDARAHTVRAILEGPAEVTRPWTTPWYYVRVAANPAALYNGNDLLLNLNAPSKIADTSWIRPGKVLRVAKLDTATGRAAVDFATANNFQYIELDCGWYGQEHTGDPLVPGLAPERVARGERFDLFEILAYAKAQGVGVILYVNREPLKRATGGIDTILPTLKGWGVAGVKYGFVNVGSQRWNRWMTAAIEKGAANELMLDAHDEYRLTGQQRTWPNILTVEGIRGNEEMPDAAHNAALVFTRYLAGPGDYTPCWTVGRVRNSLAHQLALGVATFSPWQFLFWYQRPDQIDASHPALDFWREMPTVWDETRALAGVIGDYALVARRQGERWFVAGLNAHARRTLDVPLDFLGDGELALRLFRDADPADDRPLGAVTADAPRRVRADRPLKVDCAANGGFAAIIERVR